MIKAQGSRPSEVGPTRKRSEGCEHVFVLQHHGSPQLDALWSRCPFDGVGRQLLELRLEGPAISTDIFVSDWKNSDHCVPSRRVGGCLALHDPAHRIVLGRAELKSQDQVRWCSTRTSVSASTGVNPAKRWQLGQTAVLQHNDALCEPVREAFRQERSRTRNRPCFSALNALVTRRKGIYRVVKTSFPTYSRQFPHCS